MRTTAKLRFFQTAPLKVRRYARLVIGMPAKQAVGTLDVMPSPACTALSKLIKSAIANAENNNGLSADDLVIETLTVDQGPTAKRFQPVSRGRAFPILKRSSHVTVVLNTVEEIKSGREAASKAKGRKRVTSKARKEARQEAIKRQQEERAAKTRKARRAPKAEAPKKSPVAKPTSAKPVDSEKAVAQERPKSKPSKAAKGAGKTKSKEGGEDKKE